MNSFSNDPYNLITSFLDEKDVVYEIIDHEPVFTSEQAASVRGLNPSEGAKSLLLKTDKGFVLAVLPGDRRLNSKAVRSILGCKDIRFAAPEEVVANMGCEIGACYPFGNLISIRMVVDPSLGDNQFISFNPGRHDRTIRMAWKEYSENVLPELDHISKLGD